MQKDCGVVMAKRASYTIDVSRFADEGTSLAAQMKAAGVTTVLCGCDPLIEITFSQAADGQAYHPEWFVTSYYDPQGREASQNEWNHAITAPPAVFAPRAQRESYKVFKIARPTSDPQEKYFDLAYENAVYLFSALQNAGPNLNVATFQHGVFSMPQSGLGQFGTWAGGPQAFDPAVDGPLAYWDPNRPADFDGVKGAWVACEGGKYFTAGDNPSAYGPAHTQFHCFGQ
jgi:hypothetical protein